MTGEDAVPAKRPDETWLGEWVHAPEEDAEGRRVYRRPRASPARGRARYGLRADADGGVAFTGPGATDRPTSWPGRWSKDAAGRVSLETTPPGGSAERFVVVEASADRLVLARPA